MELFSLSFLIALVNIILIDLVLAGDNAVVIAMAARNLPKEHQRKVILLGMAGAVVIRGAATLIVVKLLQVPWLLLIGGLVLVWIAYKLLIEEKKHEIQAKNRIGAAIGTIILADATMGPDNVLAVAGAAHGSYLLVILGLLISIPIIIWGSTLFIKWIERFPPIIYVGAGILAFTAAKMITEEKKLAFLFQEHPFLKWGTIIFIILLVVIAGRLTQLRRSRLAAANQNDTQQNEKKYAGENRSSADV